MLEEHLGPDNPTKSGGHGPYRPIETAEQYRQRLLAVGVVLDQYGVIDTRTGGLTLLPGGLTKLRSLIDV